MTTATSSTSGHRGLVGQPIYLDYNSTTPVDEQVALAALPFNAELFGNPSSEHAFGDSPRRAIGEAREHVATLVAAAADEIVFCGSGSEADALAIRGALLGGTTDGERLRVVTQATEHPAVLATCRAVERWHQAERTVLAVDATGLVDPAHLDAALSESAPVAGRTVVSIMLANNETGTIQPIRELAAVAHRHGAIFHCDAAQAIGKITVDVAELGVDLLTIVGHKMYAPKGIAALYVRRGLSIEPLIYGGGQEHGRRAGTEPVALIAALGAAAALAAERLAEGESHRLETLRERLHERLSAALGDRVVLNGCADRRLPNTLNVSIAGIGGHELLAATPTVAASVGSACHSGAHEPSPVLTAMGLEPDRALSAIRLSAGRWTTANEIDRAADLIAAAAHRMTRTNDR